MFQSCDTAQANLEAQAIDLAENRSLDDAEREPIVHTQVRVAIAVGHQEEALHAVQAPSPADYQVK